jgi:hypothetical protein
MGNPETKCILNVCGLCVIVLCCKDVCTAQLRFSKEIQSGAYKVKTWKTIKNLKVGDFVVFATIFFAAFLSFFIMKNTVRQGKPVAVITQHGVEIGRISLEDVTGRKEIKIEGEYNELIVAEKGRICFMEADCPDRVCVNTGWISRPGQVATCLPAGVVVKIIGTDDGEVDIYLR